MKLYNTLTRKKEEFIPIEPGKVKMYVCGPTVYNYIHIGNARPMVVFDAARRFLIYRGYDVNYVQNFTDVDDKIIMRANSEESSMEEISNFYIKEFFIDLKGLNIMDATHYPRVTLEMDEIVKMVQVLIDKGFAYEKNANVYFNVEKYIDYGKLSHKNTDDLEAGSRVEINTEKENASDFVLWKPAKPGEPKWQSPWGFGRPGWHIECSVMAKKYLGDTIDIHAGGDDLVFPHHENELAQSEAANSVKFVNYWLHNGMININNQKMSKSGGSFSTVRDISGCYGYDVIRFCLLSVHYRSPINFTEELLTASKNGLDRIKNCFRHLMDTSITGQKETLSSDEELLLKQSEQFTADFVTAMDDDFNTANAVTSIFEFVKFININVSEQSSETFVNELKKQLGTLCDILGLRIDISHNTLDDSRIEKLIEQRQQARLEKNWARADEIRNLLSDMGVVIKDTHGGVKWFYEEKK